MMHLRGKVALVTGSTSGIGLGIARVLASRGADLIINGLEGAVTAQHIIDDLERVHNVKVAYSDADIRNPDQIAEMMALAPEKFDGRNVSVLVNNAGIQHVSSIENFELEAWRRVLEINLTSNFLTIKAALPSMRAARWGRIINVASVHGRVASVNKSAYVASKHGVVGLTRAVALEAAGSGVTCNAICPGWVLTPLVQTQIEARAASSGEGVEDAARALLVEKQPSGEFATPTDLGELAAFLCTKAANQITGEDISMDGGWTSH